MPFVCLTRRSSVQKMQPTQRTLPLSVTVDEYCEIRTSLSRSRFFADVLPTSGYFPGLCVSPAVVNARRLSSPPQFRSKNVAYPTHAPLSVTV